ncbi:MAG TPA: transcription termination/antitermination protein NusG [Anaerolineae bacterium]
MRDQDELDQPKTPESSSETGVGGIEYIGSEPIKGPLIGADQPLQAEDAASPESTVVPESEEPIEPVNDDERPTGEGNELNWFVVHCYSGYENKVKHNLEQRIEAMGVANLIDKVVVPTEEEMEVRDGKRRTVEKRVFPGYILVHMRLDEVALNVVRATPGVTRFVGMGSKPTALTLQEVNQIMHRMEAEAPKLRVNFHTGQKVRITDGPFADFMGSVDKIDTERAKVTVLVSFFGRETPVELDFLQVERM